MAGKAGAFGTITRLSRNSELQDRVKRKKDLSKP